MSPISGIAPAINSHVTSDQNAAARNSKNLGIIGNKLKAGDLSAAQTALSRFQQNVQGNPPFGMNSQANSDYQNLMLALQAGDLSAAQQSLASLQTDLQTEKIQTKTSHEAHHQHGSGQGAATSLIGTLTQSKSISTPSSKAETSASASAAGDDEVPNNGSLLDLTV